MSIRGTMQIWKGHFQAEYDDPLWENEEDAEEMDELGWEQHEEEEEEY